MRALTALVALTPIAAVNADDISITAVNQCSLGGGSIKVKSPSCEDCNFGKTATLKGKASVSSCGGDEVCLTATVHAIGGLEEKLFEDKFDCSSAPFEYNFEKKFMIPDLSPALQAVTTGKVRVEFFEGGCGSEAARVGCTDITVMSTGAQISLAFGTLAAVALVGAGIYKAFFGGAAAASSGVSFSRMGDDGRGQGEMA
uniref:Uncharacterized protein n=1 Tax=Trieres chinensis TaxID=1514140 RepID=A0A7S2A863_TRICV|mmetsp:Transcript_636/g.1306  ORF Transcript_636/g.1306 Transcript_636/m.1306 type:complete len:200 (+) Transcript_636:68-667(+)|eukprot:CAMPEP_0183300684 /NCGR_PEP_ID=MMETSP0160_2-20130417/7020_1 /TAXON_ID=2839 ORGANISM="Odontella Sinensis, Strain Grunow 1884" /NCGR_SAMPLE_ID=MMETSP0160_2 /ASSEMBLY_ACC=CAM_ASM_000250 /LENGTH=199 /DNA_ID=CAMNT_0025463143 /DNA_START=39 /DNA_END=638 /DNA_ORIENTATION=-